MDMDSTNTESSPCEATAPAKTDRPVVNLIQLKKQLKGVVSENFQFHSTRNGTRVIMRSMVNFHSGKSHIDRQNLSYYSVFPKSEKPIKAVIRHLPQNIPAEDIVDGPVSLGFDVVSVKQKTATCRSPPEESKIINLPPFLVTLPRTAKSQEIFSLKSFCHRAIGVHTYRVQNAPIQCHNCQQIRHVWANCKQSARCLWCGGGNLHKDFPEKGNAASTPKRCNCQLAHLANYRSCRHEKEQLQKSQRTPQTKIGRMFSSKLTTPDVSFMAMLRGSTRKKQRTQALYVPVASPPVAKIKGVLAPEDLQQTGPSVRATNINSLSLDEMLKVVARVVQKITTESNAAVLQKIALNLMEQNGH
jgi:hypothetical protein